MGYPRHIQLGDVWEDSSGTMSVRDIIRLERQVEDKRFSTCTKRNSIPKLSLDARDVQPQQRKAQRQDSAPETYESYRCRMNRGKPTAVFDVLREGALYPDVEGWN